MRNSWYRDHSAHRMRVRASWLLKLAGVITGQSGRESRSKRRRFLTSSEMVEGPVAILEFMRLCWRWEVVLLAADDGLISMLVIAACPTGELDAEQSKADQSSCARHS